MVVASITLLTSCGGDDDEDLGGAVNIVGTWSGTRTYYNPVGGTKYQYLTVTFENNGSGNLEYEAPNSYSTAYFKYTVADNMIECSGAYASDDGDVDPDYHLTIKIEGDRLIPQNHYNAFILTRDGSVTTGVNGAEVVDKSEKLQGVWLNTDGHSIVNITSSTIYEYILSTPFGKEYTDVNELDCYYDPARNILCINGTNFDISVLSSTSLVLTDGSTRLEYSRGSSSDLPKLGGYQTILAGHTWADSRYVHRFVFRTDNTVVYVEGNYSKSQWGQYLDARGSYHINGSTLCCDFYEVGYAEATDSEGKKLFPDWIPYQYNYREYRIKSLSPEMLQLVTSAGKTLNLKREL